MFLRYIITVIGVTVFNFFLLLFFDNNLLPYAVEFAKNNFSDATGKSLEYLYYSYVGPLLLYLMLLLFVTFVFFIRAGGIIDKSYNALSGIIDEDYESPLLPNVIRKRHKNVEDDIKNALRYRDYAVKEAEERKNDLVVYLAHDLKTPLTSIIGYLTLLEEAPELPAQYRAKYTNITLEKAYRLEQLINEFFDITRFNLQSMVLENNHIDIAIMLNQMAEEFYPVFKDRNLICRIKTDEKINIIGDADKISRVFDNLMRNAVNYSYPGTEILISAYIRDGYAVISFKIKVTKFRKKSLI